MPRISQRTKAVQTRKLLEGLAKHFPAQGTLHLAGKTRSLAQLRAVFQAQLDALAAIDAARVAYADAVRKERALAPGVASLAWSLRQLVTSEHGSKDLVVLGDFGWKPAKKPGPKTTAAKSKQVQRAKATREARRRPA